MLGISCYGLHVRGVHTLGASMNLDLEVVTWATLANDHTLWLPSQVLGVPCITPV